MWIVIHAVVICKCFIVKCPSIRKLTLDRLKGGKSYTHTLRWLKLTVCYYFYVNPPSTSKPPVGLRCSLLLSQHSNLQICSINSMWIQQSNQISFYLPLELLCLCFISSSGFPSEISDLNAIINKAEGWIVYTDLLSHEIWWIKNAQVNNHVRIEKLTWKNDMFCQKIAFLCWMINAMRAFHNQVQRVFNVMQNGF